MQRRLYERLRDPRFQRTPKKLQKVSTDRRFSTLSSKFLERTLPDVDKFGRPLDKSRKLPEDEELKEYYHILSDASSEKEEHSTTEILVENESTECADARTELSSKDESSSLSNVPLGKETYRLAVMNLDWERMRSLDLLAVFKSFCPESGQILNVAIYPTEYGKYWLNDESQKGPQLERFRQQALETLTGSSASGANTLLATQEELDKRLDSEIARQYELDRMKYYVGVVVCDSISTALSIYEQCDGLELEGSGNVLDLRFIPDEIVFSDSPRDIANHVPNNYEPKPVQTLPLQHTSGKLSWDEDDPHRVKLRKRRFTEQDLLDDDLKTYLASSDSEEEEGDKADVYRQLASELVDSDTNQYAQDEENLEMEATFISGLDRIGKKILESREQRELESKESAWEKRLRKMKSKKHSEREKKMSNNADSSAAHISSTLQRKSSCNEQAELELLCMNSTTEANGYSSDEGKQRKTKKTKPVKEDFSVDTQDPRFAALYYSYDFALDPTDPRFKKTSGMKKLLHERSKRLYDNT